MWSPRHLCSLVFFSTFSLIVSLFPFLVSLSLSLWFGWRLGWRGGIRFIRLESLLAWLERERLATLTSTPISHSS
jgi:hypothetical protein